MEQLKNYFAAPGVSHTPESLINMVSKKYNISVHVMKSKSRVDKVAEARMYAMYLIHRKLNLLSQYATGALFNRDHSTVFNACSVIETRIETNQLLV